MANGLRGDQGTVTFSSGNVSLASLDIDRWTMEEGSPPPTYRPFGFLMPRRILTGHDANGTVRVVCMDGTTPPGMGTQSATTGTLVLGHKSTTQKNTLKAIIWGGIREVDSTTPSIQYVVYRWAACADSNTDDIVVA